MVVTATKADDDNNDENATADVRKQPLVIVAIEFKDYHFHSSDRTWHDKIFGTGAGSLNNYYGEISYNRFQFVPAKETQGTHDDGIIHVTFNYNHPDPGQNFFRDRVEAVKRANEYIDFSQYDKNSDGALSRDELQIMLLVAGGENAYGGHPSVWAMQTCLNSSHAPTLDGVVLMACRYNGTYSRFGERHGNHDATVGIIAHELGHAVFDLPDLYATDDSSSGIGNFGLMGGGSWGYQSGEHPGATPVHMTGWSKIQAGFIKPTVVTDKTHLPLKATNANDFVLYKIPTNQDKEYFLIANRAGQGYDRGFYQLDGRQHPGGALILHIDDNLWPDCRDNNDCNNDKNHKLVDVVEAKDAELDSGRGRGTSTNFFYKGNKNQLTPDTTPSSDQYDGSNSGVHITNISDRGATMYADIKKD